SLDPAMPEALRQFIEANSMARVSRDFAGAQAKRLDDLQNSEKRRRLDSNDVPWFGHRAQTEVQCLGGATRHNQIVRCESAPGFDGVTRDLKTQASVARRRSVTVACVRIASA